MDSERILVDTSIIIDYLRKDNKEKSQFYRIIDKYDLYVSAVTMFELFAGATDDRKRNDINKISRFFEVLPFTEDIARRAGEIFLSLKLQNKLIEIRDLFIGATAVMHNLPVLTLNKDHFNRIEEIQIPDIP
jgi:tRNA(fMet)-specific endonuclease VapC